MAALLVVPSALFAQRSCNTLATNSVVFHRQQYSPSSSSMPVQGPTKQRTSPAAAAELAPDHGLMRAAAFNAQGGPEVLQPVLWRRPTAAPGRVLVRVVAASINPVDCKVRAGKVICHWSSASVK